MTLDDKVRNNLQRSAAISGAALIIGTIVNYMVDGNFRFDTYNLLNAAAKGAEIGGGFGILYTGLRGLAD